MKCKFFFLSGFLFLSSCHCPVYVPPCPEAPCKWKTSSTCVTAPCVENWWDIFQDPFLASLEVQAIANNPDLYIAYSRIVEARALAGVKKADLFPQVTLDPHYTNQGRLFKIFGVPSGVIPGLPSNVFRIHQLDYYFPFDMSYEFDLWGRIKKEYASAKLEAQAVALDFQQILLSITADLASYYFNIRSLDAAIAYYEKEIAVQQKNADLIERRFEEGLISRLDVTSANLELNNLKADQQELIRQRGQFENAVGALIGLPASEFCMGPNPLTEIPPCIPPGVPCSILVKRPDILEAERRRASKYALVGARYAALLPTLTISGILGFYSPTLRDFLTWHSRHWLIGAAISQTIFDGGKKIANLHAAWACFHQADGEYQRIILTAFQEVEDALNNLDIYAAEYGSLSQSRTFANERLALSEARYREGLVNYLEVLDSERSQVVAEINLINVLGARYQSTIQLIRAIGGSWQENCSICSIEDVAERKTGTSVKSQLQ